MNEVNYAQEKSEGEMSENHSEREMQTYPKIIAHCIRKQIVMDGL